MRKRSSAIGGTWEIGNDQSHCGLLLGAHWEKIAKVGDQERVTMRGGRLKMQGLGIPVIAGHAWEHGGGDRPEPLLAMLANMGRRTSEPSHTREEKVGIAAIGSDHAWGRGGRRSVLSL